ncbi:arylesterase [Novosphingobium marinum]|uniref:Acyl-CoA thioesterase-1 n=1 Tax=Novosphingobium marinum TaxID=1514948 RepID=A0A7Y9XY41_9SPHN|nr:arylesterase [Novosphingobium marinum]NYH95408.1 acyl-CoA thioesterase-1 [Novosphingobium marinum]GGC26817.1 arylesterase [Novosphingobium marinum]
MIARIFLALPALALAACGSEAPPAPPPAGAASAPADLPVMGDEVPVLAFGDSLLAGYGLDDGESYPAKLEAALRSRGVNARVVNAGVSGDTTADGLRRLEFTLNSQNKAPALVVISLGGNDMLRGLPVEETRNNLDAMLDELSERGIPVVLLGMLAAPNMGKDYASRFNAIYPAMARKHNAALVPFFLQAVMDRPDLLQDDRIHPTAAGIEAMVGDTVDTVADAIPAEEGAAPPR